MSATLSERFSLFNRYQGWLFIYFPLFCLVSLPAAYILDIYFPAPFALHGKPLSLQRFIYGFIWLSVVTILIWPTWHWLGDLFLPKRDQFKRLRKAFSAYRGLERTLRKRLKR